MPLTGPATAAVTIASGASLSGAAYVGVGSVVGIQLPTITNAALTFQASLDGTTYAEAVDAAGSAISVAASTGARVIPAPAGLEWAPYLKIRSGTSGAPVNQGAERVITLIIK